MASPYIIPAPKFAGRHRRGRRRGGRGGRGRRGSDQRGRIGAITLDGNGGVGPGTDGNGGYPGTGNGTSKTTTPKKSGVPIGAAVIVILGVVILSNVK